MINTIVTIVSGFFMLVAWSLLAFMVIAHGIMKIPYRTSRYKGEDYRNDYGYLTAPIGHASTISASIKQHKHQSKSKMCMRLYMNFKGNDPKLEEAFEWVLRHHKYVYEFGFFGDRSPTTYSHVIEMYDKTDEELIEFVFLFGEQIYMKMEMEAWRA